MSRVWAKPRHPLTVTSMAAELDAALFRLAATSTRFHVRRHLEAHTTTCTGRI